MTNWIGEEWEAYCMLLIRRHYGADQVQRVPARHGGDLGIEAFTFDGHVFQCYAAQEPLPVKDRYESQRNKLTTDLIKLELRQSDLCGVLGGIKIRRYMFMVPLFDSHKLVQHAGKKSTEFAAKRLPHLHADFRVVVTTDDAFAQSRAAVLQQPRDLVQIDSVAEAEVQEWMRVNDDPVGIANGKLRAIINDESARAEYLETLIGQHVEGGNALALLRPKYPDQWEAAVSCVNEKERLLVLEYSSLPPETASVTNIVKDLERELGSVVPALGNRLCRKLAWSAAADWLMRCPLRFAGTGSSDG